MQRQPDILEIPRGDPKAAVRAFVILIAAQVWIVFYLTWQAFRLGFLGFDWGHGLLLLACIAAAYRVVDQCRIFAATFNADTPYLKMDDTGLSWSLPMKKSVPWWAIEACACRNERYRTVLRVFPKGRLRRPIDIDFALAANPKQSLDEVLFACDAWIRATRDPWITDNPIREFANKPPAGSAWASRPPKPAFRGFIIALAFFTFVAVGFVSAMSRPVREEPPMPVDGRPEKKVLFLGNSRIAVNDLPHMVRDVADSARSPIRYDLHMRAWGGATLKEHWSNDGDRAALVQPWDLVIVQPESAAFMDESSARDTNYYGSRLIQAAEAGGSHAALIANWGLGPSFFYGGPSAARAYAVKIGRETRTLAQPWKAGVIDLDGAFAEAEASAPDVAMTDDGNHPSHAGTFLAALVIYGYLSHADLSGIGWRPYDMSEATAATLKQIAARHVH